MSSDDFWVEDRPFVVVFGPEYPEDLDELFHEGFERSGMDAARRPHGRGHVALREENAEGLAGTLFTLSLLTANDEYATAHLGDVELLRAWLKHPHFRMLK